MSRNRAALPCADIGSQTSSVVFRESCPLLVRQLPRDAVHTNVDVVGTIAIREMIELFQKVVGILRRERRRSFYRTNRTMACLARRYASAPVTEHDELDRHRSTRSISHGLWKPSFV